MYDSALLRVRASVPQEGCSHFTLEPLRRAALIPEDPASSMLPEATIIESDDAAGSKFAPVDGQPINMNDDRSHPVEPHPESCDALDVAEYNSKVVFALKLGYTEAQLQNAIAKLGSNAGQNQILEELIRLQKAGQRSPVMGNRPSLRTSSSSSSSSSSSLPPVHTDHPTTGPPSSPEDNLLPIVIDGTNVAMSHGNKERFSCKGIRICVEWFRMRGHKDITVFVPKWRKEAPKLESPMSDQHILMELERERILSFTPSRQVLGKRFVCHDDRYILNLAADTGAIVVSNDNYREFICEKPEFKKVIEEQILMYSFVNDRFMPPDDPLGRKGPSLDSFLRKKSKSTCPFASKPCPYKKKCTYGMKCKFYHPESSSNQSISEALKMTSSLKISDFYNRNGHSSGDSCPGDSLMRTQSMQPAPLQRDVQRVADKEPLCKAKSLSPVLESWLRHAPPGQCVWSNQLSLAAMPPQAEVRLDYASAPPPPAPSAPCSGAWDCIPTEDTVESACSAAQNPHRKLARQLTLNPAFDPRLHASGPVQLNPYFFVSTPPPHGNSSVASTNTTAAAANSTNANHHPHQHNHHHNHLQTRHFGVARIASAPECGAGRHPDRVCSVGSMCNPGSSLCPYPGASQAHPYHLHPIHNHHHHPQTLPAEAYREAFLLNLSKSKSDVLMQGHQPQSVGFTAPSDVFGRVQTANPEAVYTEHFADANSSSSSSSSGCGGGGGNGGSSMGQVNSNNQPSIIAPCGNSSLMSWSTERSVLYYHLTALFPHDQVEKVMNDHPDEHDSKKLCQYILACANP